LLQDFNAWETSDALVWNYPISLGSANSLRLRTGKDVELAKSRLIGL